LYGGESWRVRRDYRRLISAEMHIKRRAVGHTLSDGKKNEEILGELQILKTIEFIELYRTNWKECINRMSCDMIPKMFLKYQPKGK
jgi:hypothetical protein